MWTPKRIVLLVMGFALFCTGYFAYSFALGGIDGLPPLPEAFLKPIEGLNPLPPPKTIQVEEKLRQAFGLECLESKRAIKLQLSSKDAVVAAETFDFDDAGRMMLKPFSVALFGKPKDDGKGVEINTIRSNVAYLTFDRPISRNVNPNELNGRKIVGFELQGDIEVVNNRRSPARDDDLELFIKTGPLYYEEKSHLIWTYDNVHGTDRSSKPKPHEVWGKVMEIELVSEAAPAGPGHKPRQDSVTGVKRITLQSNVDMHLYVDGQSGFMNKPSDKKSDANPKIVETVTAPLPPPDAKGAAAKAAAEPEKSLLHITTPGRFQYFFHKDFDTAHFEVTPGNQQSVPTQGPADVTVIRYNEKLHTRDQLFCEKLDLTLTRKEAKPADKNGKPAPAVKPASGESGSGEQNIQIETADAYGRRVTLTSDAENFSATEVVELHHNAKTKTTVLKGNPCLVAEKEGSTMYTPQLFIEELSIAGSEKTYQKVTASGPGSIDMLDKNTNKRHQHAYWNDALVSSKDEHALTPKGEMQDLLILMGKARFVDDKPQQTLRADTLKVWFSPSDKTVEKATPAQSTSLDQPGGPKVQHVEGIGNVSAESSELNIPHTDRLVAWFKDAPPTTLPTQKELDVKATVLPAANSKGGAPPQTAPGALNKLPPGPVDAQPTNPSGKPAVNATPAAVGSGSPAKKEEAPRPIDLTARSVEVYVLREEAKNNLDHLFTEGNVHVIQAPAKDGDQGVDIRGETLSMYAYPEGKLLTVTGNDRDLANLRMDKIYIVGPEVNIDQVQNKVWVTGAGGMTIDSTTTLSNKPLDKSVPLEIMWQKSMLIWGRYGEFNSGIQAKQEEGRLTCNDLCVTFDKPISLKEGPRDDKAQPKVKTLQCDKDAIVEDRTYEEQKPGDKTPENQKLADGRKLMKYQRLVARIITLDALEAEINGNQKPDDKKDEGHEVRATGPGYLILDQRGADDPLAASPKNSPAPQTPAKPPVPGGAATPPTAAKSPAAKPGAKPAAKPEDDQLKMTLVTFGESMYANSHTNFASFRKNVRVLNMPVDDPSIDVEDGNRFIDTMLARLPEGAMYLSCNHLEVWTRQEKGKNYQEMYAREQAVVQGTNFWGRADTIHFDELKDQIIFEGGPGGLATVAKFTQAGEAGQPMTGKKIFYNRTTGALKVDKAESLQVN